MAKPTMAGAAYNAPTAKPTLASMALLAFNFSSSVCDILLPLSIVVASRIAPIHLKRSYSKSADRVVSLFAFFT
ncbi:MAG: hypothetical protein DCE87_12790 [Betaproteobacteria bacterium]|nr:hypothetical protein [Alcaligenaceae bacterium]PZO13627.1 MAG: hypothetical protein DCE87_12790 [Betaproteobacteria bacterium]PZO23380.1 MAG: hypothetical protein DCE89_10085 [Betaproteobacteria bacterium]PZO31355.1 MAG: hypothetical protein DCE88_04180 [Betaproteobacteria bacterium]